MDALKRDLEKMRRRVIGGQMSRRQFLAAASAMGLAGAAPGLYREALAQTPKRGGKVTLGIGHGSTTDGLDPGTYENDFTNTLAHTRYNFLTEITADKEVIPELAEGWDSNDSLTEWTFRLRTGIEHANGKTMDAEDVINSINHHRGEDSTSAAKPYVDVISDIKADGKNAVRFTLAEGNADFPYYLSDYHLPIMPTKDGKADWQSGIGTGAYVLEAYEPGVRASLKRNPNFWKEGRGHADECEYITIADVAARANALTTNEVNIIDRPDIKTLHLLERDKSLEVIEASGNAHYSIPMRTNLAPLDNNDIRLALKYSLDREALLQKILRGHGYVGNDHPIGRGNTYHADDLPQKSFDPDKAKFHLKKAGVSNLTVELAAADAAFGGAVDAAVLYKEDAAKNGITIEVARVPNDGYWANVWNTDNHKWAMCYWGGRPTEDLMFSVAYADGAPWNDANWSNAEFNRLLRAARAERDDNKRRQMYYDMQRIVSDEGGTVVPLFNNFMHVGKGIGHGKVATNWSFDGLRFMERWWVA